MHNGIRELRTAYKEAVDARRRAFCVCRMPVYAAEPEKHVPEDFLAQGKRLAGAEMKLKRVQLVGTDKAEELVKAWNALFYAVKNEWIKPADFVNCMDDFLRKHKRLTGMCWRRNRRTESGCRRITHIPHWRSGRRILWSGSLRCTSGLTAVLTAVKTSRRSSRRLPTFRKTSIRI